MENKKGLDIIHSWQKESGKHLHPISPETVRTTLHNRDIISVILDDDPTGSQTVYDVEIICQIEKELISKTIDDGHKAFFLLTNDRSLTSNQASRLLTNIGKILAEIEKEKQVQFQVLSRGDSTLRSHFPIEVKVIAEKLRLEKPLTLVIPAFFEGHRYTYENRHYAIIDNELLSADKTEFAKDPDFSYSFSYLPAWIAEKDSAVIAKNVATISINDIRTQKVENLSATLISLKTSYAVVNALEYADLYKLAQAVHLASTSRNILFQAAASFVKAYLGLGDRPLCEAAELGLTNSSSGIIIVGSHVKKTTSQLSNLLDNAEVQAIELENEKLVDQDTDYLRDVANRIDKTLINRKSLVIYTGRTLVRRESMSNAEIGEKISSSLCTIIRKVGEEPDFIITKGGITSHNIATSALNVKRARVVGQWLPGVPIWQINFSANRMIPYIIFPGNVGDQDALLKAYNKTKP